MVARKGLRSSFSIVVFDSSSAVEPLGSSPSKMIHTAWTMGDVTAVHNLWFFDKVTTALQLPKTVQETMSFDRDYFRITFNLII